jgi:leucyl aminopeptidase
MGKPSRESKIPKGIGEIVIKTIDRVRTSFGTTLGNPTPKEDNPISTSIFLIKSPGLQNEIKEQTNIMHMRNKIQKLKTTPGGILTPQNLQKQYAAELNEFSGAEIVIKDLHTLRNKDMLRLPASNDYSWTPNL